MTTQIEKITIFILHYYTVIYTFTQHKLIPCLGLPIVVRISNNRIDLRRIATAGLQRIHALRWSEEGFQQNTVCVIAILTGFSNRTCCQPVDFFISLDIQLSLTGRNCSAYLAIIILAVKIREVHLSSSGIDDWNLKCNCTEISWFGIICNFFCRFSRLNSFTYHHFAVHTLSRT